MARNFLHGDIVSAKIVKKSESGRLAEVDVKKLLQRSEKTLLGYKQKNHIFPLPQISLIDKIKIENTLENISDGTLVEFRVEKNLAHIIRPFYSEGGDEQIESVLFLNEIPETWNKDIEKQEKFLKNTTTNWKKVENSFREDSIFRDEKSLISTHKIQQNLPYFSQVADENGEIRVDFRNWHTITIDGADVKDLDDAISIAKFENGEFLLGVHIADVSHYVSEKSPIDMEAMKRGTSIYLPTRVIPMLGETLSNNLCSLTPHTIKNTLSCIMRIHPKSGKVLKTDIVASIIESRHRGVYDDIFENFTEQNFENTFLKNTMNEGFELFEILKKRRKKEGKMSFETTELYFDFDDEKKTPIAIRKRERNNAHILIEEFMVITNEEVAKWCSKRKIPFLSRVHPEPSEEATRAIFEMMERKNPKKKNFEKKFSETNISPRQIAEYLEKLPESERYFASRLILPKMSKAYYSANTSGHFGLALDFYSHFTSPIRRYPDLATHRMIHSYLARELDEKSKVKYQKILSRVAETSSATEKRAESVEREVDKIYSVRFMQAKIGEKFRGTISSVIDWGIFVELDIGIEVTVFFEKNAKYQADSVTGTIIDKNQKILHKISDVHTIQISSIQDGRIVGKIVK